MLSTTSTTSTTIKFGCLARLGRTSSSRSSTSNTSDASNSGKSLLATPLTTRSSQYSSGQKDTTETIGQHFTPEQKNILEYIAKISKALKAANSPFIHESEKEQTIAAIVFLLQPKVEVLTKKRSSNGHKKTDSSKAASTSKGKLPSVNEVHLQANDIEFYNIMQRLINLGHVDISLTVLKKYAHALQTEQYSQLAKQPHYTVQKWIIEHPEHLDENAVLNLIESLGNIQNAEENRIKQNSVLRTYLRI